MDLTRPLILFHRDCRDGWCAAWIARKHWSDAELVAVAHGDPPPDVTERDVLVLDFSYSRDVLLAMKATARSLHVYDHHRTAEANLRGLDFCTFDMERSGAGLTLDAFYPGVRGNDLFTFATVTAYVEDRDLWRWKLPNSKAVNAALSLVPLTVEAWDALPPIATLAARGDAILAHEAYLVEQITKNAYEVTWAEGRLWAVNSPVLQSEVGHTLVKAKGRPALVWSRQVDGRIRCSLRSEDGLSDVSEWAKRRGGGGHRNASGFTSDRAP